MDPDHGKKKKGVEKFCPELNSSNKGREIDSKEYFISLFENMEEGVVFHKLIYNAQGKAVDYIILDANHAFVKHTGVDISTAIGSLASKLYGSKIPPYIDIYENVVTSGIPQSFETYYPPLRRHFRISAVFLRPGYFGTIFTDITHKVENEEKIILRDKQFELIASNITDVIWMLNLNKGKFTYVSPSITKNLGYSVEEAIELTLRDFIYPEDYNTAIGNIAESIKMVEKGNDTDVRNYQIRQLHKDGSLVWSEISTRLHMNHLGEIEIFGISRNISESVNAQEELKAKEKQLRMILENMQEAYIQADNNGRITFANPALSKLFGYTETELSNMSAVDLYINAESRELLHKELRERGKVSGWVTKAKRKDGSTFWISMNAGYIKNDIGEILGSEGALRDITEWMEREKELKLAREKAEESDFRLRLATDSGKLGIWDWDIIKDKQIWNDIMCRMYQADQKELDSRSDTWSSRLHPEDREKALNTLNKTIEEGPEYSSEFRIMRPDGSVRYIRSSGVVLKNSENAPYRMIGINQDITDAVITEKELRRNQDELSRARTYLQSILDSTDDLIWSVDSENFGVISFNKSFYNFFSGVVGVDVKPGMTPYEILPADNIGDKWIYYYNKAKEIGPFTDSYAMETTNMFLLLTFNLLENENGVYGISVFAKDITNIKMAEREMIIAKERAEESDRLKSAFLMNMSHEIRTPMNGILGFIGLLNEKGLSEEERTTYLGIVSKSGERLLETINDIIEISKIETGDIKLRLEPVNIYELMLYYYDFFSLQTKTKGLELKYKFQNLGQDFVIITDKQKIDGIMINLLKNAVKFTTDGYIEFGFGYKDKVLELFVRDTGKGIASDKKEMIFQRFVQAENDHNRGYEGSGLGLSIVDAYVEALNGQITVETELGAGSTFKVFLPCEYCEGDYQQNFSFITNNESIKKVKSKTILIAEDDEISFEYLEAILSNDFNIIRSVCGEETVNMFLAVPGIDLILMDIKLPGEYDGLEATRRIRRINREIPILAQTAFAMDFYKTIAMDAGCNDYLYKPINRISLISLVNKYIKES
jgi:hypothetical protein